MAIRALDLSTEPARRIATVTAIGQALSSLIIAVAVLIGRDLTPYDSELTTVGSALALVVVVVTTLRSGAKTRALVTPVASPLARDFDADGEL